MLKRLSTMRETLVRSLGGEDLLEKEMATHSSILARKIPWMEEPGRLQSMGPQSRTQLSNFIFTFTVCQALGIQLTSFSWIYYLTPSFFFSFPSFLPACYLHIQTKTELLAQGGGSLRAGWTKIASKYQRKERQPSACWCDFALAVNK